MSATVRLKTGLIYQHPIQAVCTQTFDIILTAGMVPQYPTTIPIFECVVCC